MGLLKTSSLDVDDHTCAEYSTCSVEEGYALASITPCDGVLSKTLGTNSTQDSDVRRRTRLRSGNIYTDDFHPLDNNAYEEGNPGEVLQDSYSNEVTINSLVFSALRVNPCRLARPLCLARSHELEEMKLISSTTPGEYVNIHLLRNEVNHHLSSTDYAPLIYTIIPHPLLVLIRDVFPFLYRPSDVHVSTRIFHPCTTTHNLNDGINTFIHHTPKSYDFLHSILTCIYASLSTGSSRLTRIQTSSTCNYSTHKIGDILSNIVRPYYGETLPIVTYLSTSPTSKFFDDDIYTLSHWGVLLFSLVGVIFMQICLNLVLAHRFTSSSIAHGVWGAVHLSTLASSCPWCNNIISHITHVCKGNVSRKSPLKIITASSHERLSSSPDKSSIAPAHAKHYCKLLHPIQTTTITPTIPKTSSTNGCYYSMVSMYRDIGWGPSRYESTHRNAEMPDAAKSQAHPELWGDCNNYGESFFSRYGYCPKLDSYYSTLDMACIYGETSTYVCAILGELMTTIFLILRYGKLLSPTLNDYCHNNSGGFHRGPSIARINPNLGYRYLLPSTAVTNYTTSDISSVDFHYFNIMVITEAFAGDHSVSATCLSRLLFYVNSNFHHSLPPIRHIALSLQSFVFRVLSRTLQDVVSFNHGEQLSLSHRLIRVFYLWGVDSCPSCINCAQDLFSVGLKSIYFSYRKSFSIAEPQSSLVVMLADSHTYLLVANNSIVSDSNQDAYANDNANTHFVSPIDLEQQVNSLREFTEAYHCYCVNGGLDTLSILPEPSTSLYSVHFDHTNVNYSSTVRIYHRNDPIDRSLRITWLHQEDRDIFRANRTDAKRLCGHDQLQVTTDLLFTYDCQVTTNESPHKISSVDAATYSTNNHYLYPCDKPSSRPNIDPLLYHTINWKVLWGAILHASSSWGVSHLCKSVFRILASAYDIYGYQDYLCTLIPIEENIPIIGHTLKDRSPISSLLSAFSILPRMSTMATHYLSFSI